MQKIVIFFILLLMAGFGHGQTASKEEHSPLTSLGNEYQNSIKLLSNRFRIDYHVDEVTMVFFREYGSSPVVLVRPDGSKLFLHDADGEKLAWFDSESYDMISIKDPVPGPWQAVGQILQNSRVMVMSEIKLHADPLPKILFSGEILKQTARLTNGGELIDYGPFRDVVDLNIELASTNNPDYDNFGAQSQEIARFEDNGRGMDERPMDGVFTGQFNLSIAAGEWRPVFRVSTPMFTREQVGDPITLYATPIYIDVELHGGGESYHLLKIDTNRDLVDINSLLIDGKVRFPNGDIQNFSLTQASDAIREHMIVALEEGIFRVKLTAYGKTVEGRDFILDVPEYTFLAKTEVVEETQPLEMDLDNDNGTLEPADSSIESPMDKTIEALPESIQENSSDDDFVVRLMLINGVILLLGSIVIGALLWRKNGSPNLVTKIKIPLPRKKQEAQAD